MTTVVDTAAPDAAKRAADSKPKAREFDEGELAVSTMLGGFFTALAVADLSMDLYAGADADVMAVRAGYLGWKAAAPIISQAMLVLVLPLPFVFYMIIRKEVMPLVGYTDDGRPLGPPMQYLRALGSLTLAMILGVVTTVITTVLPLEQQCAAGGDCEDLWFWHAIVVLVNLVLLVLPFLRYGAARAAEAPAKHS